MLQIKYFITAESSKKARRFSEISKRRASWRDCHCRAPPQKGMSSFMSDGAGLTALSPGT
jgi:hypothetical protein